MREKFCQSAIANCIIRTNDNENGLLEAFQAIGINELSVFPSSVRPLRGKIRQSINTTCTLDLLDC